MAKTVIGLFDDYEKAQEVVQELVENGFDGDRISTIAEPAPVAATMGEHPATDTQYGAGAMSAPLASVTAALVELGMPASKASYYAEAVHRGGTLVCVRAEDDQADAAIRIIDRNGSVDMNNRMDQWRQQGWEGLPTEEVVVFQTTHVIDLPRDRRRAS